MMKQARCTSGKHDAKKSHREGARHNTETSLPHTMVEVMMTEDIFGDD
jgi:hypothetical protein